MLTGLVCPWRGKKGETTTVSDGTKKKAKLELGQFGKSIWETSYSSSKYNRDEKKDAYVGVDLYRHSSILKERQQYMFSPAITNTKNPPKDKTYKINRAKLLYLCSLLWSVNFQVEFQQQKYIL